MDDVIMRFNEQFIDNVIFLDFLAKRSRDSSGDADVAPENPASACKMHCLHMCICMNVLIICYFARGDRNENTSTVFKVLHHITIVTTLPAIFFLNIHVQFGRIKHGHGPILPFAPK
jgi:hypothetical protein